MPQMRQWAEEVAVLHVQQPEGERRRKPERSICGRFLRLHAALLRLPLGCTGILLAGFPPEWRMPVSAAPLPWVRKTPAGSRRYESFE